MKHLDWYMTMKKTSDKRNAKYYDAWSFTEPQNIYIYIYIYIFISDAHAFRTAAVGKKSRSLVACGGLSLVPTMRREEQEPARTFIVVTLSQQHLLSKGKHVSSCFVTLYSILGSRAEGNFSLPRVSHRFAQIRADSRTFLTFWLLWFDSFITIAATTSSRRVIFS